MKNIRSTLALLLLISYVSGLKIVEFSTCHQRYFNLLYILLFWSVYYFLLRYTVMPYINVYTTIYHICLYVEIFTVLLSIAVGVYHNKKFKDCLKKLTIVDNTLEKLGMITDYRNLYMKTIWFVLGWIVIVILLTYIETLWLQNQYNYDKIISIYIACIVNYCSHLKFISNLIFANILRYIKLKFVQINKFLWNLTRNKHGIVTNYEDSMSHSHQRIFRNVDNSEWLIYLLMHLHLELCKISREIDTIFGVEMTISMGCYFCWLIHCFYEIFLIIFSNDYIKDRILYTVLTLTWCFYFIVKLLFINHVCEKICIKANTTGDLINKISSSNCDVDHKNILQFLLQIIQMPLKFCGLGLFQFGYKVFHDFSKYTVTILVILAQMHMNKRQL